MLGLLLLYFIGKYFAKLAAKFNKKKWVYVVAGIVTYYAGAFVTGIIIGICYVLFTGEELSEGGETLLSFIGIPFGILGCWGLYKLLERNWSTTETFSTESILDSSMIEKEVEVGSIDPNSKN